MKLINDLNLFKEPLQLKFDYGTLTGFPEFYHAHQGMEILYIRSGSGDVYVNRQIYEVRSDTLVIFQPYQLHRIRMKATPDEPYVRTKLLFEPSHLDEKLSFAPGLNAFLRKLWKQEILRPVLYGMRDSERFAAWMDDYGRRLRGRDFADVQETSLLALIEFLHLLHHDREHDLFGAAGHSAREPLPHHAETMIHWLETHLHEPLALDLMAKELHLSKPHLSRLFKRATGSTISEFLNILRVQKACRLLETTTQPVQEIAGDVGIANTSYFCEVFKQAVGQTPLQYRLQLRKL